jgi:hypothetical protein
MKEISSMGFPQHGEIFYFYGQALNALGQCYNQYEIQTQYYYSKLVFINLSHDRIYAIPSKTNGRPDIWQFFLVHHINSEAKRAYFSELWVA